MGTKNVGNGSTPDWQPAQVENEVLSKKESAPKNAQPTVPGRAATPEIAEELAMHIPSTVSGEKGLEEGMLAKQGFPGETPHAVHEIAAELLVHHDTAQVTMHCAPIASTQAAAPLADQAAAAPARQPPYPWDSFEQVTRHYEASKREGAPTCEAILKAGENRTGQIDKLCENLQQGVSGWNAIITRYGATRDAQGQVMLDAQGKVTPEEQAKIDSLAYDALKAFHDHKITAGQFFTLCSCYSLLNEHPGRHIGVHALFNEKGEIDKQAQAAVAEGIYDPDKEKNFFTLEQATQMVPSFFENMRQKSASEQCFFYMEHPSPPREGSVNIQGALGALGFRMFDAIGPHLRMIPSFSMIEASTKACEQVSGKGQAATPWPTIGKSNRSDMRRNLNEAGRDMYNPFPGVPCPSMADGFPVDDSPAFICHDAFHCMLCSMVPGNCKETAGMIADLTLSLQEEYAKKPGDTFTVPFLETVYGRMVDLEFSIFRLAERRRYALGLENPEIENLKEEEIFLLALETQLIVNTADRMLLKLDTLPSQEARARLSDKERASLQRWDAILKDLEQRMISRGLVDTPWNRQTVFMEMFLEFCARTDVFKNMANAMYKNGVVKNLNMTQEDLSRLETLFGPMLGVAPGEPRALQSLPITHQLVSIVPSATSEQTA